MSELYLILFLLLTVTIIICFKKVFNEDGLIYSIIILNLLSYVSSLKIGILFNSNINLSIIPITGMFTALYIYLNNNDDIKEIIKKTSIANIIFISMIIITTIFYPSVTDTVSLNLKETLEKEYILLIIYPIIIAVSEYIIYKLYKLLNKIQNNIMLSILLTYIITSLLYTIIFNITGTINILSLKESVMVGISTYIIGLLETIVLLIYIKITVKKKVQKWKIPF